MLLQIILVFSIYFSNVLAKKNFWDNEICTSDSDCSGLNSCDFTFGCTLSAGKVGLVMFSVFLVLCVIAVAAACFCRQHFRNTRFARPNNQYLPSSIIHTNTPQWNQHQIGVTTVYPHNPYPNQFYANAGNPPLHNQYQMGMGQTIHASQVPTGPHTGIDYGYGHGHFPQTQYAQR